VQVASAVLSAEFVKYWPGGHWVFLVWQDVRASVPTLYWVRAQSTQMAFCVAEPGMKYCPGGQCGVRV